MVSFSTMSILCESELRQQIGAQYLAGAYTRARIEILRVVYDDRTLWHTVLQSLGATITSH